MGREDRHRALHRRLLHSRCTGRAGTNRRYSWRPRTFVPLSRHLKSRLIPIRPGSRGYSWATVVGPDPPTLLCGRSPRELANLLGEDALLATRDARTGACYFSRTT